MSKVIADKLVENLDEAIAQLARYVACPSVSADPAFEAGMEAARCYVEQRLTDIGLENVRRLSAGGKPAIYGDWLHKPGAPTVLIYGHYDVMPPDPLDDWLTKPFTLTRQGDRLYGRGAADNKGSSTIAFQVLGAFLTESGALPLNVKVLIEGEEECGAPTFGALLAQNAELLAADCVLSADGGRVGYWPAINVGCRGMAKLEVSVTTAGRDLHSGRYGGAVRNALHELVHLLSSLHDRDGNIAVAGFLPQEAQPTTSARAEIAGLALDEAAFFRGIKAAPYGASGYAVHEKLTLLPAIDVNGVTGGYQGPGPKTVIPRAASAKLSLRLVPGQEPQMASDAVVAHLRANTNPGVELQIDVLGGGIPAYSMAPDGPLLRAAEKVLTAETGQAPLKVRHGGTLPVACSFLEAFGIETLIFGFGVPDDAVHAPNESYAISSLKEGMRCWAGLLTALAEEWRSPEA